VRSSARVRPIIVGTAALWLCGCSTAPQAPASPSAEVTAVHLEQVQPGFVDAVAEGLVHGVAESGGKCRFTFWAENGAASRLTGTGTPAGSGTTRCGPVSERAGWILPYGRYEVELRYESAAISVKSERFVVELQP